MTCEAISQSLVALLDGELRPDELSAVERHLGACGACVSELRLLRATRDLVQRHFLRSAERLAKPSFDELWQRAEPSDDRESEVVPGRPRLRLLRGSAPAPHPGARRRAAVWVAAGGLAVAASLALVIVTRQQGGVARPTTATRTMTDVHAPAGPVAQRAVEPATRVAAAKSARSVKTTTQVAKGDPVPGDETGARDEEVAVVANEIDPPRELVERPDLFVNYPLVRKLEEMQHLESVLADPPDEGGAG